MSAEIAERFVLAIFVGGLVGVLFLWANRVLLRRNWGRVTQFSAYRPGLPAIVYFTAPTCAPCKTVQRPAIERVRNWLGERLQVIEVDVSRSPEVARAWGVLSVPTTFVLDAHGKPRHVNHGVRSAEVLIQQLGMEDYSI